MESSRCFRASRGELGCISCHDPHRLPAPATKAAYYRERCLECHEQKGCALPSAERQARGPGEDCIACHMPRLADHEHPPHGGDRPPHPPRRRPARCRRARGSRRVSRRTSPLMDYHWGLMTEEERRDAARDLGVALSLGGPDS